MNKSITCPECKNEIPLKEDLKVGDVIECPFCGVELELTKFDETGVDFIMIEEEK